jgi:hypothetical protein
MIDARQFGKRAAQGRIVTRGEHQRLLEEGSVSRLDACRLFRGDMRSLLNSSLRIVGWEEEVPSVLSNEIILLDAAERLEALGAATHLGQGDSLEDIAIAIRRDAAVVLAVNAGELVEEAAFFDSGTSNQLVMPAFTYRDPESLELVGFRICYPDGEVEGKVEFVSSATLRRAWLNTGGRMLIAESEGF